MRSVFSKLLIVILIAVIGINLLVFVIFRAQRHSSINAFHHIMSKYLNYLIQDLGNPPSPDVADRMVRSTLFQFRFRGADLEWTTDKALLPPDTLRWLQWKDYPHIRSTIWNSRYLIEVRDKKGFFLFSLGNSFDQEDERNRLLIPLLLVLTTLIILVYISIRWILKPIKWLHQGVLEISRGNLYHRVPSRRSDELKDLAQSFNAMTQRIREMLHSKERLLLDVSHELRSPLTRIRVALEFLPESHARVSIRTDVEEMEKMIAETLDTAKMHHRHGQLKMQKVDLAEFMRSLLTPYSGRKPSIEFRSPQKPVICMADPDQIKLVVQNIINNAFKYSDPSSGPISIFLDENKSGFVLTIRDQGIGIPGEELPFIMEPFYRVDKSRSKNTGGYGLGLSICKTIMEAHGGKIEINSVLGKGTSVLLTFLKLRNT